MLKNNNTTLIIGGSSTIGKAFINENLNSNEVFISTYFQNKIILKNKYSKNLIQLKIDLNKKQEILKLLDYLKKENFIPSKILHIASKKLTYNHFSKISWKDFEENYHIQVRSLFYILQFVLPFMKKSKFGKILTILSSVVLFKPPSYMSSYVTTKYALLGLINSIVSEYYKYNISFNCISPSMIETNFLSNVPEKIIELSKNQNPQKKNVDVKDLVRCINYFFHEETKNLSGINFPLIDSQKAL